MENSIAYCGLNCSTCPIYKATQMNSDDERRNVAEKWSSMFNASFTPEQMNCDGCHSQTGKLFGHCKECAVRLCGIEKKIDNCAQCSDYSCEKLDTLLKFIPNPAPRKNLEAIRILK
jgi:hypothetical protein